MKDLNKYRTEFRLRLDHPAEATLYQLLMERDRNKYKKINDCLIEGLRLLFQKENQKNQPSNYSLDVIQEAVRNELHDFFKDKKDVNVYSEPMEKESSASKSSSDDELILGENILDFLSDLN